LGCIEVRKPGSSRKPFLETAAGRVFTKTMSSRSSIVLAAAALIGGCAHERRDHAGCRVHETWNGHACVAEVGYEHFWDHAVPDYWQRASDRPALGPVVSPTRVCIDGSTVVFENNCGCNDALVCTVERVANGPARFALRTDPSRPPRCRDCFPMEPARCALPADAGVRELVVNGAPLVMPATGCWVAGQ
jgi:hypothetical protein